MNTSLPTPTPPNRMARFLESCVALFHAYATWLVSITWWRFILISLALAITMAIIHDLPPFSWTYTETILPEEITQPPTPPKPPKEITQRKRIQLGDAKEGLDISIDERGVRIQTKPKTPSTPAQGASAPASTEESIGPGISIQLPPNSDPQAVRDAIAEARKEIEAAIEDAKQSAREAAEEAAQAARPRIRKHRFGDPIMPLTMWFILISAIVKVTYKGKVQAEAKAAVATEVAESESLKRQVIEARMAAMQAQVEPHFLFNTLASIDHLIETDPPRASIMQKNLIALLRASMPTMREANAQSPRDLGRELAVIRPYLEILKVRMEERLQTEVRVSDGLLSAEFPPMMLQSLVENAIKHGLEPKAEGGNLTVSAEIIHGKLAVTVADTGLGFGKAATAGTGIGLTNIRERLALLYGNKASLSVKDTAGGGTSVTITVPYIARADNDQPE